MRRHPRFWNRQWFLAQAIVVVGLAILGAPFEPAFALITGGEGNQPISDPGWPAGAAVIVNNPTRIAYWVGPPFGGGQWHAEYRGDAAVFNEILASFAKLDVKTKRLVVHDGVGHSFWLHPNREPDKKAAAEMDWMFVVWEIASWERMQKMPAELKPGDVGDAESGPPSQIDVYIGDNIRWPDVNVPDGIEVDDRRMESHGFTPADGNVLEGKVTDLATKQPLAARMRLELIEPQEAGGYKYTVAAQAAADAEGHWVLKNAPAGWYRVVVEGDEYVPRIVGHARFDEQPRWHSFDGGLSRPAAVAGRVADDAEEPLADVDVRLGDVIAEDGGRYESPAELRTKTDADGRFELAQVPLGKARIWIYKAGYCRAGLGPTISTPTADLELSMQKSAQLRVKVDFGDTKRPQDYILRIEPEGGSKIGSWGGSGGIDEQNEKTFSDVPPGRYVIQGQPNPSRNNEGTEPVTVELKGGETTEITLSAN
jgi:hypothetical protein